ncbi:PREDICTED: microtubule-associated tumor suppressor 1 homolog isoform X2 [Cyprinodon variegatus]|uniref:Microtubule-associated tumor suppressor 1 homolog n=1 Tax=Cyprinodon variegatus TaxID=28743 RepID=A0A3Q2DAC9_CYPVA|nr:PREDICTED: microtubule-associated tumor suppressor 1 homolog isoform X2 [Cyprinodon variegatus]
MNCSALSKERFHSELDSHPTSKMNQTFNLSSDPFKSSVPAPQRDGQISASPDPDGISSLSEREARGSPYINTDCRLNEQSSVGKSRTATSQEDPLSVVTSNMTEGFIVTPGNQNGPTVAETCKSFIKHEDHNAIDEKIPLEIAGIEGKLSLCGASCRRSRNDCISLSSGEIILRNPSFCLEDQSLLVFSSMEDSSFSPAASCMPAPYESSLSAFLPDVCRTSAEMGTKENVAHSSLGMTFIQEKSTENPTGENDMAPSSSDVPLPSESGGSLFTTFICETPTDTIEGVRQSGADVDLQPQVSEEFTPEVGKTFGSVSSGMLESDDDVHTSTPVQVFGTKTPNLSYRSPCIEHINGPGFQLEKRHHISVTSKGRPVASVTPSICKAKKTELQRVPKSDVSAVKSKVFSRLQQQAAVSGTPKLQRSQQVDKQEINRKTAFRITAAKVMSRTPGVSTIFKTSDPNGQVHKRAAMTGASVKPLSRLAAASSADSIPAVKEHVSEVQGTESSFKEMQASESQLSEASAQHATSLSCASNENKSTAGNGPVEPKPTTKKDVSNQIGVRSGSVSGQDRPTVGMTQPRSSSESSATSRPLKENKAPQGVTASLPVSQEDSVKSSAKASNVKGPPQQKPVERTNRSVENSRGVKKISLVAEPSRSTIARPQLNESKSRSQGQPSPRRARGASLSQPPAAGSRAAPLSARLRLGVLGRPEDRNSRTAGKAQSSESSQRAQAAEEPFVGTKRQQNASKPPQTPSRPSSMGPPATPAVRPPRKMLGQESKRTTVSGGAANKQTPFKPVLLRPRLISTPAKNTGSAVTTVCRSATSTSKGASSSATSPQKKTNYGRPAEQISVGTVNKCKTSARLPQQQHSNTTRRTGSQKVVQDEGRQQKIQQLEKPLASSDRRFQALVIVLQQTLAERDEATRQSRQLSQELANLKGELASSVHSSECLEREKEELHAALHHATQKLQEEHRKELAELEQRLQAAHRAEWDHVQLTYQEEANKYKTLMQQQMEELKANHEAMKMQLESCHAEQLQSVRQQYETSMEELRKVHAQELQSIEKALKDTKTSLSKDSHALYLEQELESLKAVLDIKNEQLHQQEKMMMEISKLKERNVKLNEILIKVQQENEDLKARMERHAALSRQLSTEQAVLQESLQKESKVNKRLSMENEELLWKLHNGDLSSPRKLSPSPTSPSHPFKLQSPRSSGFFSSSPVSPR